MSPERYREYLAKNHRMLSKTNPHRARHHFGKVATPDKTPSPFYELMAGATTIQIALPEYEGECALTWDENGVVSMPSDYNRSECVDTLEVVKLGPNHFRLAEWGIMSAASLLGLHWGDEFFTERTDEGIHILTRLVIPQPFVHLTGIDGPVKQGIDIDRVVHELGGGWTHELCILTWSVPQERLDEFYARIRPTSNNEPD